MKLNRLITIGILMIGTIIYGQDIKKDVVEKDGIKNNISSTKSRMYEGTTSEKAKALFQKAYEFSEKQDFKNAEKYYLKALKEDPNFVEVYDNLGRLYRRIGKYDKAISNYKKSLELYPKGIMAHQNLAVVYAIKKEYDKAIIEYKEIIKLSPDNAEGYFGLANSYMMLSKFDLAAKNAERTVEIYKKTNSHYLNEGYYLTGLIYYYWGNNKKAKENLILAKENGAKIEPKLEKELFSNQSNNENIQLKTKEDFSKHEQDVINGYNWLMKTPIGENPQKRKEISAFLLKWMTGSPNVSLELSEKIVTYMDCGECLMIFMSGWTNYALTTKDLNNKFKGNLAGTKSVIEFYKKNKKALGKNNAIEKFIKLDVNNKLEDYIKSKI